MFLKKIGYGLGTFFRAVFLLLKALICVYPVYWMFSLAFKTEREAAYNVYSLPTSIMTVKFSNFKFVLDNMNYWPAMKNSLIYAVFITFFTTLFATTAAYAMTRMHFKAADLVYKYFLIGLALPAMCMMVPVFMILNFMQVTGTRWALLILGCAAAAAGSLLMIAYMRSIPFEMEEAAAIDGCNCHRAFLTIMLPILKPSIATRAMLEFLRMWNEFGYASILCMRENLRPITLEVQAFFGTLYATNWAHIGAAVVLTAGPAILVYCFANKGIENAMTAGAILK